MQVAHKNLKQVIDYLNFKAQITWQYNKSLNKFHMFMLCYEYNKQLWRSLHSNNMISIALLLLSRIL